MSEQLKPCPFCGSNETARVSDDKITWVTCTSCRGSGPFSALAPTTGEITWNTRATDQGLSASENLLAACQADLERWQEAYGVAGDATWALLRRLQEHLAPHATQHGSLRIF